MGAIQKVLPYSDTAFGVRQRLQANGSNRFPAILAEPVGSLFHLLQSPFDLAQYVIIGGRNGFGTVPFVLLGGNIHWGIIKVDAGKFYGLSETLAIF